MVIVDGEGAVLGVNLGPPIVTSWGLRDAALPKLLLAELVLSMPGASLNFQRRFARISRVQLFMFRRVRYAVELLN